jgi:hypothetical protein
VSEQVHTVYTGGTVVYLSPQDRLRQCYQQARRAWQDNPNVREMAATIGMSEREYCDGYLRMFPTITWTGSSANVPAPLDYDRAYREASS